MAVGNVSFGAVIAVTGTYKKMGKLNNKLKPYVDRGHISSYDVTSDYKKTGNYGAMANAARKGEQVMVYVTANDTLKIKNKEKGWQTKQDVLGNMSMYVNMNEEKISTVFNMIV